MQNSVKGTLPSLRGFGNGEIKRQFKADLDISSDVFKSDDLTQITILYSSIEFSKAHLEINMNRIMLSLPIS